MRTKRYLIGALAAAAALGSCGGGGGGGYTTDDLRKDLEGSGDMSAQSAQCIADRVGDSDIDVSKLNMKASTSDELSAADQEAFAKIFVDCALEEFGGDLSLPDASLPDVSLPEEPLPD